MFLSHDTMLPSDSVTLIGSIVW